MSGAEPHFPLGKLIKNPSSNDNYYLPSRPAIKTFTSPIPDRTNRGFSFTELFYTVQTNCYIFAQNGTNRPKLFWLVYLKTFLNNSCSEYTLKKKNVLL